LFAAKKRPPPAGLGDRPRVSSIPLAGGEVQAGFIPPWIAVPIAAASSATFVVSLCTCARGVTAGSGTARLGAALGRDGRACVRLGGGIS